VLCCVFCLGIVQLFCVFFRNRAAVLCFASCEAARSGSMCIQKQIHIKKANASLRDILRIMFCGPSQIDGPGCRNPDAQRGRLLSRHAPDRSSGTANGNFQERGPRRTAASSSTSSRPSTATAVNGCDSPAAWWRSNSSTCRSARAACSSRSSLQGCCLWDFWCPCSPCGVHPALLASACRRRTVRCPCLSPTCSTSSRYMIICTGCVPAI